MTHWITLAICVDVGNPEQAEQAIAKLFAPYDEGIEVEPYTNEYGETTRYNPNSKWDWYVVGGRYNDYWGIGNMFPLTDFPGDVDWPLAVVTPDGVWHEKGRMGWFGNIYDPSDTWESDCESLFEECKQKFPGAIGVLVDTHI